MKKPIYQILPNTCLSGLNRCLCFVKGCQMLSVFCKANLPTGINKVTLNHIFHICLA